MWQKRRTKAKQNRAHAETQRGPELKRAVDPREQSLCHSTIPDTLVSCHNPWHGRALSLHAVPAVRAVVGSVVAASRRLSVQKMMGPAWPACRKRR